MSYKVPRELRRCPKKSLGYGLTYSSVRIQPVTGREWVYTADDEQMKVLYDIEDLWAGLMGKRFIYVFREVHGLPDNPNFDGWEITIRDRQTRTHTSKRFAGFPPSARFVLSAVQQMFRQFREREIANGETV